jgi:hypothetical protein
MAQVTLGKFFSGVPQKRKSDGDSKKIYEHKRKRGITRYKVVPPSLCSMQY